jgi:hypothetical protein
VVVLFQLRLAEEMEERNRSSAAGMRQEQGIDLGFAHEDLRSVLRRQRALPDGGAAARRDSSVGGTTDPLLTGRFETTLRPARVKPR